MKTVEIITVIVYFAIMMGIGFYFVKRSAKSETDYWVAGRSVHPLIIAFGMYAGFCSASSFLGSVGMAYASGISIYLAYGMGCSFSYVATSVLVASPLRRFGQFTVPDFFLERYQSQSYHLVSGLVIAVFMWAYLLPQMAGAGHTSNFLLGIPYAWALVVIGVVFVAYVAFGGMWAVSYIDALHGIMMLLLLVGGGIAVFLHFGGGPATVYAESLKVFPKYTEVVMDIRSHMGLAFMSILFGVTFPHVVVKNYAVSGEKAGRWACVFAAIIMTFGWFFGSFAATGSLISFAEISHPDQAFLYFMDAYFPKVLVGIGAAAIIAAVMSTTDALLLSVSSSIARDVYKGHINKDASEKKIILVGRITVIVAGILAVILSLKPPPFLLVLGTNIVQPLCGIMAPPILFGIWWKKANVAGAFASLIVGGGGFLVAFLFMDLPVMSQLLYTVPASTIAFVVVSLLTPSITNAAEKGNQLVDRLHDVDGYEVSEGFRAQV